MPTPDDIIQLPCSEDLIQAGTAYVTRSLVEPGGRPANPDFDHLRAGVVDKAVELAFRRLVTEEDIPHQLIESVIFSQPDTFDVAFGGRRCVLSGMVICRREEINRVHNDLDSLVKGMVYLRESRRSGATRDVDLYIFAFLTGLVTRSRQELQKALNASQPVHLIFPMTDDWAAPPQWDSLGTLTLKGDITAPVSMTLTGQDRHRGYLQSNVEVPSRERVQVEQDFNTLNVLQTAMLPDGPVGVHSPRLNETLLVSPYQWGNVWVYGMRIFLVGYISQGDFYRQAESLPPGSRVPGDPSLDEEVSSIPASALKPMEDLFVRAENWAQQSKSSSN
jgi:hypothetical protein